MKKTAIILIVLTMLSKILGFVREIVLSYFYGTSGISDAYIIAFTISSVVFSFVAVAIKTTYIPMYSSVLKNEGEKNANVFTNNIVNFTIVLCSVLISILFVFAPQIVKVFASGFEGEVLKLSINFTRYSIFSIFVVGLIKIYSGYLQVNNNFYAPALVGVPLNIVIILSIVLSSYYSVDILVIGRVIAVLLQLIFLLYFVYKKGYSHQIILDVKDSNTIKIFTLAIPVMLGTSVNQLNRIIDRTLASRITIGGVSALNYAGRLNIFIIGIIVMSIVTVFFADISKLSSQNKMYKFKHKLKGAIIGINLLVIPSMLGIAFFTTPIIKFIFARGEFGLKSIEITTKAQFFYSLGLIGFALREVLSRAFYSLHDTKTPMKNAMLAMFLNIILNIILSRYMGISGLALATSISAIFCTILLFVSLRKKIGNFFFNEICTSSFKIFISSVIMIVIIKLLYINMINVLSSNISLILIIIIGVGIYSIVISFMKIEEVDEMIRYSLLKIKSKI